MLEDTAVSDLFEQFDTMLEGCLEDEWTGSIMMDLDKNACGKLSPIDICEHLGKSKSESASNTFYFDREKYPPPQTETLTKPEDLKIYDDLKRAIRTWAFDSGSQVKSNGGGGKAKTRRYVCSFCSRLYKPATTATGSHRKDSIVNSEKKGRRQNGRSLPRRSNTRASMDKDKICPFQFSISWNENGYYLLQSAGNKTHKHHPKVDPKSVAIPGHLIDKETRETILHMSQACIETSAGANYVNAKLDRHVTRASIAYMQDSPSFDNMPKSDIASLLDMFRDSNEISYSVLWDAPFVNDGDDQPTYSVCGSSSSLSSTFPRSPTKVISEVKNRETNEHHTIDHSFDKDFAEIASEALRRRVAKGLSPKKDKVFVAVAWANKDKLRLFRQHPFVLYCDSTGDSNKKAKHLFTVSGREPSGKQFVILRAWVHNQRRSTFKWLFQSVIRTFLPASTMQSIQLVLVDGDPQQRGAIESMLRTFFPSSDTKIGTCAWHLFSQGYKIHIRNVGTFPDSKKVLYDMFVKTLMTWLYSFTRPGYVEDIEEYNISKKLLSTWVKSNKVTELLGAETSVSVLRWLLDNVFPYEEYFCLFRRMYLRTFYQATTSPHEGTNFGLKSHSASAKPCHTMDKAGRAMSFQDSLKAGMHSHETNCAMMRKPVWSSSLSSKHLLTVAESLLTQMYERIDHYEVRHISKCRWEVKFCREPEDNGGEQEMESDGQDSENPFASMIPKFDRIRIVTLIEDDRLHCSCFSFESRGIPCVHTAAIIKKCNPDWKGFSHHDCSLCWWRAWNMFSHNPSYPAVSQFLCLLEAKKIPGPKFSGQSSSATYDIPFPTKTKLQSVSNYDFEQLEAIFGPHLGATQETDLMETDFLHTQETHLADSEIDQDDWAVNCDATFEGFMDPETDKTGAMARELLKHDVQEMYDALDEYNKLGFGNPMANKIRNSINDLIIEMREAIATKRCSKRPVGNIHYIADEIPGNKYLKRTHHSRNC